MIDEKLKEKVLSAVEWLIENNIFGYVQVNCVNGKIKKITKCETEKIDD